MNLLHLHDWWRQKLVDKFKPHKSNLPIFEKPQTAKIIDVYILSIFHSVGMKLKIKIAVFG